ncbi:MAG: hypothetical protein E5V92_08635 [Mesorhizobium sp.]|uniref:hypothetical protein n=1 Tax=unclassified Mesorhizobium TaxID=325217 RepID=UPI000F763931|nr:MULTISPECIES: hypothetical protein [unclassified Mesorhizobium]AZO73950.1 hypothetical protein EJ067_24545 [Mesorhizobium sp. M1D.F.Ca.ET.043.01.1.1]RWA95279.1 MAG: hypothetical protein EOQ32_06055 [Mesorhizobium sp.]RWE15963.1 MAG: hypothetical protein EOS61_07930 [Mesorhizobium sp.]TJW87684.1 MAG: hypothetical protein E5V92_08635 [Mesorhizobium sp.]
MASKVRAIPAYTAKDYPHIRQLPGADNMPATWEEWHTDFEASKAERLRRRDFTYAKVLVRPGKFKGWLDENSFSATEHTRQLYAQERLDSKRAREEGRRELKRMLLIESRPWLFDRPRRVAYHPLNNGSFGLFHAVVAGLLFAWLAHHWLG